MGDSVNDHERRLNQRLADVERKMRELDARDDDCMERSYKDPQQAEDDMVRFVEREGEHALFLELRERPERFGEYPADRAKFDDAYMARKELAVIFADYQKLRDESDEIQRTLNTIRRERDQQEPDRDRVEPTR